MHVPVQDMRVCCVQQMGTHMRMCVEAQRIPTGTDVQDGHSSRLASLFFSTQVLLRYAAHAGDCNPLFGPRFQGRSLSPAFFLFFGESIS